MIKAAPIQGYSLKEAEIELQQLAYVDDQTTVTTTPKNAQLALDTLDSFLSWTACMKAKPHKCRAVAFKVFNSRDKYEPLSKTKYSAYDPKLHISGEAVPFLGDEPFKFLGRKISIQNNDNCRTEIKENLLRYLETTTKANLTGPMKLWLYNNFITAYVTWPFMIYDLPITFGEELKAIATKFLKMWMGFTKTVTSSVLYRSKDHFGLGLTDLVTHLKKMQVCRMHILKNSQDTTSKKLYTHMRDRDKPPLNGLGIPISPRIWKPTNALEKIQRNIFIDTISLGHQHAKKKKDSLVKQERHNILKRIEKEDEESHIAKCHGYAMQGDWLNFDAVLEADLSWKALIYTLPQELLKFLVNSTHNVLPTPDNLSRWGKTMVDIKCNLCGYSTPTLKHVLNGCPMALNQGRYTWRHDNILQCIVKEIQIFLNKVNSETPQNPDIKRTFVEFVKEGGKPKKSKTSFRTGLLFTANDWVLACDTVHCPLMFPPHITQTSLRPDLVIYSNSTKQVVLLELTVPTEDNIVQWHIKKEDKYEKLIDDISMNQWSGQVFGIEIGSRGYVAKSLGFALGKLGLTQSSIRSMRKKISLICLRSSYLIYLSRKNTVWRPWEAGPHPPRRQNVNDTNKEDTVGFGGFSQLEIREAAKLNERKCSLLRSEDTRDFGGFSRLDIGEAADLNKRKCSLLRSEVKSFSGFGLKTAKSVSSQKTTGIRSAACSMTRNHLTKSRKVGLLNIGNTCYMNSVMQCLNSVTTLVGYFKDNGYHKDISTKSKHGGSFAREVGAAFKLMNKGSSPVSLHNLKAAVGKLHHPFGGSAQQDSHEFLLLMLDWLHGDLGGGTISPPVSNNPRYSKPDSLFQGINQYSIMCSACHYESISLEPFTITSLSIPSSGKCTLQGLLKTAYETSYIDYKCPQCSTQGLCTQRSEIRKLPSMLILHLKRFDNSSRKIENEIEFPLVNLNISDYVKQNENKDASFNLCGVTNHYGTLAAGHYTSLCRSLDQNIWYKCDDQNVTKTRMSGISNAAYMLFYELSIKDTTVPLGQERILRPRPVSRSR